MKKQAEAARFAKEQEAAGISAVGKAEAAAIQAKALAEAEGIDKKAKPERSLIENLKKNAGRNSYGRITVRHRGGGNKRKYRIIDFPCLTASIPVLIPLAC